MLRSELSKSQINFFKDQRAYLEEKGWRAAEPSSSVTRFIIEFRNINDRLIRFNCDVDEAIAIQDYITFMAGEKLW